MSATGSVEEAPVFTRIGAVVIDTLLCTFVCVVYSLFVINRALIPRIIVGFQRYWMVFLLFMILYFTAWEATHGFTLGKAVTGLTVVSADGTPVSRWEALVRNVLRVVDMLPGVYLVGLFVAMYGDRNQRVGDIGGRTLVVTSNAVRPVQ